MEPGQVTHLSGPCLGLFTHQIALVWPSGSEEHQLIPSISRCLLSAC